MDRNKTGKLLLSLKNEILSNFAVKSRPLHNDSKASWRPRNNNNTPWKQDLLILNAYIIFYLSISLILIAQADNDRSPLSLVTFALAELSVPDSLPPLPTDDDPSKEVDSCEACRLVVDSFERGLEKTARGKHEGGDTSWEEKNLKTYQDSEVRLVEIQENLCENVKKGKAQCLSVAEDSELYIEEWWFNQRNKNVRLHDYLCISKLKVCCPSNNFGPNCQVCKSECNKHGTCDGAGTRSGTGKCNCEPGYVGSECDDCDLEDYFRVGTGQDRFTCRRCHQACKGCFGLGQMNCTDCRSGYYKHESNGCIDVNECDTGVDSNGNTKLCGRNQYCVNTDGGFKCADCHVACLGCVDYGPNQCISCAQGYQLDDEYTCRSEDELEELEEWDTGETLKQGRGTSSIARYFFYVGVLGVSVMMFRSNLYVMYSFIVGFILVLILSELNLLDEPRESSMSSPK